MHLLTHIRQSGNGFVNSSVDLALEQADLGLRVTIVGRSGSYLPLLRDRGVAHRELPLEIRPRRAIPARAAKLRAIVRELDPDVVHSHVPSEMVLARPALLGTGKPLVATAHNQVVRSTRLFRAADRIIAVSDAARDEISSFAGPGRVVTVKNAIVGSHLPSGEPVVLDRPAVLYVGGLNSRKGLDVLLKAFASVVEQVPSATLYVVGGGPDRAQLEQRAATLGISARVRFAGFQLNPRAFMQAADVLVLPSFREPFGRVLGEAREAGCAVVASNVGGIPEVLEYGRAGVLVAPGDVAAFGRSVVRLLTRETEREELVSAARRNLDWLKVERMARETVAVYQAALAQRTRRRTPGVLVPARPDAPVSLEAPQT
ncbi:MAG: glycosyltransferase [Actinomycetes bacterium]